ncbi:siroheme synthase CysG [Jannaschia pohangensis]|uniref:Uroporphyrin-III C-methyltransferase / precorrin-2 dehydrogenase / sirohydrochlorin ferrochelatase n=1 Tax=Jannaschia pohangensis TaxID=390807 RepID=A0A1I3HEJ8_9RHOB|nr:siroheme synthase CysG [Jannaschia pohangensis]SFI34051.1 uroporphyrin-III C-methyltransferase / precorrin-2 dehydrogenase / sirohydrochlorin ferrochelatase [Jannaschia pohangensis]
MKAFPMFIRTTGRRVVIAGGGEQAAQKARLVGKTDATLVLLADALDDELSALVAEGRAIWEREVTAAAFRDAALVFIATGCPGTDGALHGLAKAAGAAVNVVDRPELCDMTTPSIVDRAPVVVAIGTEGTAPVLGRMLKTEIETMLDPNLGALAELAGRLRVAVAQRIPRPARRAFWRWMFEGAPAQAHARGAAREAAAQVKAAIEAGRVPDGAGRGHIALVGAGPGARDLLTLRAVARLQEADVIFHDRLVDPDVLELARRDAERVFVGKEIGACAWPQDRINALIVAEARRGRRVVRLKSGDPSIFGRATEELAAARDAGIPVEVVPGVTAASGAAAALGQSLTERGATDTLVLATGTCRPGDPAPDWTRHLHPGTSVAVYMGVAGAGAMRDAALAEGVPPDTGVVIAADVSRSSERLIETTLDDLPATLTRCGVTGTAVLLMRLPKSAAVQNLRAVG